MVNCEVGDAITKKDGFRFAISNSRNCYKSQSIPLLPKISRKGFMNP